MNIQIIIVLCIVLAAGAYVGNMFWKQAKATAKKSGCGNDCGCGTKDKVK